MRPEDIAKSGTEYAEQAALFAWAALNQIKYPCLKWAFAIPNGGFRFKSEAGRLKASGVKPGVPDILLPVPKGVWAGLFIEMKRKVASRIQHNQYEWLDQLVCFGYRAEVCYGWEQARDIIEDYLNEND